MGNSAYLVDLGDGRGLAVDAGRDLRALHSAAQRRGLTVAYAADTHLHADLLSGAVQLGHEFGTAVLVSADGHQAFPHRGLAGDEVDLGGLRLRAPATPGHTDEHVRSHPRPQSRPAPVRRPAATALRRHRRVRPGRQDPRARVMVALAGVHAARAADMLALRLDDVDLGGRRIIIAGRARLLDDLTHRPLLDWLCRRTARWPDTANPHLLVNHITATTTAPASGQSASLILHRQAATLERLRMDRILEEALACGGDLLHLASVFGLDTKTAIRYAASARELLTTTAEEQDPAHSGEPKG
ncbi:hypothetical protein ABT061_25450 [Streptosporangium sp. NPDC002544]|uniref:hypothetical protein n=1 Tax=Streptosporangium sp. NPDC002544 TaxID=3154538 RepID=UPI003319A7A8